MQVSFRPAQAAAAGAAAFLAALAGGLLVWLRFSPRPLAVLLRVLSERDGRRTSRAMARHVPEGISEVLDQQYLSHHAHTYLDVFFPEKAADGLRLPTIVWIHGGGWISGNKNDVGNYLRILASYGFTTVGVDYSLAHVRRYPAPVRQSAAALRYLTHNADRLHIDTERLVLAGDSAGAQIAAQLALVISDPDYARKLGIASPITPDRLRAVLLHCGAYDLSLAGADHGGNRHYLRTVLWSYTGAKDYLERPYVALASVARHVDGKFPPAFVSAGNADPLLPHSLGLVTALKAKGSVVEEFFPETDAGLGHQYQFNLELEASRRVLELSVEFLRGRTA
ncbi:lipase LipA [Arthrobacter crystallopoietes BAB-32]|uniref:Lipase LipA n=1 Tax=Arthrobacter crystallopoietes BAB-32 TaxID=1246476 RepID=N1UZJ6_9MICC|nr:alpha/beta hydrolase [Arthrobacter crystallopoietes]EMY35801.1 lipase LipA [Arthrobacter crystallopoietes BAB-32]